MITASQVIYRLKGQPEVPGAVEAEEFRCWVCAGASSVGVPRDKWMGSNFTDQNRVRCPDSTMVCAACVNVMAGRPPDTERMWSHFVDGDHYERHNKGAKAAMRDFLFRPKRGLWLAAIADSGKKHIIPWTPVNRPGGKGGMVLFEERRTVIPGDGSAEALIAEVSELLTLGASKEGIERGEHSVFAWERCPQQIQAFEARWAHLRGGAWFALAVWLAQRDEDAVQARMAEEKAAKAAKKEAERVKRTAQRGTAKPVRRAAARAAEGVPADDGGERPEALGQIAIDFAGVGSDGGVGRGVGDADASAAAAVGAKSVVRGSRAKARRPRA